MKGKWRRRTGKVEIREAAAVCDWISFEDSNLELSVTLPARFMNRFVHFLVNSFEKV